MGGRREGRDAKNVTLHFSQHVAFALLTLPGQQVEDRGTDTISNFKRHFSEEKSFSACGKVYRG